MVSGFILCCFVDLAEHGAQELARIPQGRFRGVNSDGEAHFLKAELPTTGG